MTDSSFKLTIAAAPKAFEGHVSIIQKNAIKSWGLLEPKPEIILFGEERGLHEAALELGVKHFPDIKKNEFGVPLLSSIFEVLHRLTKPDLFLYINSDIILMDDFMKALLAIRQKKTRFLIAGRRTDLEVKSSINFGRSWQEALRAYAIKSGYLKEPCWIDYFLFTPGLYESIPDFAIGRPGFDNWLLYKARAVGAAVIDATAAVIAIHQTHDYSYYPGGDEGKRKGEEARRNLELAGGYQYYFDLEDSDYVLTSELCLKKRPFRISYLKRYLLVVFPALHPRLGRITKRLRALAKRALIFLKLRRR